MYLYPTTSCLSPTPANQNPDIFVQNFVRPCISSRDSSAFYGCLDNGGSPLQQQLDGGCYNLALGKTWQAINNHPELLSVAQEACSYYHYRCKMQ